MVVVDNRNALNRPADRHWSYGLCDCFSECGICTSTSVDALVCSLTHHLWQAAVLAGVPAWSLPKANNVSEVCKTVAALSRAVATNVLAMAASIVASSPAALLGPCRYVELASGSKWGHLIDGFRWVLVGTSDHATASVEMAVAIAVRLIGALLVRSHRSAVKLCWRRGITGGVDSMGNRGKNSLNWSC